MNKKIISFSLYGNNPVYQIGAFENLKLQKKIYPDWICRFYISQEIPARIKSELRSLGAEVVEKERKHFLDGRFWRFLPTSDRSVDILIVRDTDSRLSLREKLAVDEWLNSDKSFHIMRDHPFHRFPILGGMWGCRGNTIPQMDTLIAKWKFFSKKIQDQDFLGEKIYPKIMNNVLIHSEFVKYRNEIVYPFPTKRENLNFVGKPYLLADTPSLKRLERIEKNLVGAKMRIYTLPIFVQYEIIKQKYIKIIRSI